VTNTCKTTAPAVVGVVVYVVDMLGNCVDGGD